MDIFSHGLYGGVAFGRKSRRDYVIAFLFGVGPDLLSFGIFFLSIALGFESWPSGNFTPPNAKVIPEYVHMLYNVTHSLVVYTLFFVSLWAIFLFAKKGHIKNSVRHFIWLTLGWPLHILVDIPTHANGFFPTPFLWPVSSFSVNGVPWASPEIFIPNLLVLTALYWYWHVRRKL